jgi:hypothetical protein
MASHALLLEALHQHACRHCGGARDEFLQMLDAQGPPPASFASICAGGEQFVARALLRAEAEPKPMNGITTFCEKCHRISIIPFEYYRNANTADGGFMFQDRVKQEHVPVFTPHHDETAYYTWLATVYSRLHTLCTV